ncbi:hypothetical protein NITLEN_50169 [Nitrospira lenta]|uniref:Uncharacterized protein n=1 Tax=Nitrospira lenta TaxID=1436998 RepID=A0A330LAK8_9BACT|nr:hypothetical protein NITLEN_50169 [Nitrospira lenta]
MTGPLLGQCLQRAIPQSRMAPLTVVEDLNVLRDLPSGLFPRSIAPVMYQFVLQRAPNTFHRGIVVAIASLTHGRGHAEQA